MGRVVVITGGTSGIGLALKELYEKNGDTVLTFSLDETGESNHYCGSVDHEIKVKQVFNDIHERFGKIDILINNAGFGMSGITELVSTEDMRKLMDVNFFGTTYCTRAALQYMEAGAKIINLSSAMALFPVPFRTIYGAAKSAVLNFSFGLRMELAPAGIQVSAICPGDVKTNFTANRLKDYRTTERYGDRIRTATEANDARQEKRMPVEFVAEKIFKAVEKQKLKPFYIIGGKYKFLYFLTRITPKSLLLNITGKKLGGKMTATPIKKQKTPKVEKVEEIKSEIPETPTTTIAEDISVINEETTKNPAAVVTENTEVKSEVVDTPKEEPASTEQPKTNTLNSLLNKMTSINKTNSNDNKTEE